MLIVIWIAVRDGRYLHQLGAAERQHVLLLLALRLRDHDQRAVAARVRDQREPDSGVAGGALDHETARPDIATLLGLQDHRASGAVLDRLARVHEFGLAQNGASGELGRALELDQRRVADRLDDTVANLHGGRPMVRGGRP